MKILLVSNGNLAESLVDSMNNYFTDVDIAAVCFSCGQTEQGKRELKSYFLRTLADKNASFLIFCDIFGSTAFNEVNILVRQLGLSDRTLIVCGMNLPMIFKAYGLIDTDDFSLFENMYTDSAASGIHLLPVALPNAALSTKTA